MQQLSGLDSALVLGETPNVPLHIGALFVYDPSTSPSGSVSFEDMRTLLLQTIEKSLPMLKCRTDKLPFIMDKPYWVKDENFTIDYHLERFALPQPADWKTLHEVAARFHALPLHPLRPQWQALYLENLDHLQGIPAGSIGLVFKIHHALADGKVAIHLFSALHTLSPEAAAPVILQEPEKHNPDFSAPGLFRKYSRAYWHNISAPLKLFKNIIDLSPKILRSPSSPAPSPAAIPDTPFNGQPSADRLLGHIRIPMPVMECLKQASGCTVNDIALCIIAGGIRDYLQTAGQLPDKSLVTGMPIDIRGANTGQAIGNQISFVNVCLHSHISDHQARLAAIHDAARASRQHNERIGAQAILTIIDNLHPGLLVWAGKKAVSSGFLLKLPRLQNTITTNVPGIPLPCYLAGAQLLDYIGIGLLPPTVKLFHVISSIHTHINISFLSCSTGMQDTEAYTRALQSSYQGLLHAFGIDASASGTA